MTSKGFQEGGASDVQEHEVGQPHPRDPDAVQPVGTDTNATTVQDGSMPPLQVDNDIAASNFRLALPLRVFLAGPPESGESSLL